eukprot:CAMPEP_0205916358 /NCGR_PEP_ID=MMETSP1325-20131115/8448_1 /ASSEMBLY_ACC=CAM_ASM_000708 /TAXON_ID=236786 /ORGANISM="Florenciella sp., Strain RCC1007" /LENGTH=130 /DNA_ID=CAMNT_0053283625 /DNA_START=242 /DNA_END=630 /DNA_ORIENTATION=+
MICSGARALPVSFLLPLALLLRERAPPKVLLDVRDAFDIRDMRELVVSATDSASPFEAVPSYLLKFPREDFTIRIIWIRFACTCGSDASTGMGPIGRRWCFAYESCSTVGKSEPALIAPVLERDMRELLG